MIPELAEPLSTELAAPVTQTRVVMTPDGRMNTENAARYLGVTVLTLKNWRFRGKKKPTGPPFIVLGGRRVWYFKTDLDRFIARGR
jgi:hypothetical protein